MTAYTPALEQRSGLSKSCRMFLSAPGCRSRHVYGLVTTLPHSAAHAVVFSFHTPDFLEGCVGCLARLGGVPDKLVLDNDSSIVEPRRPRRPPRLHDEVAALFGHLRCLPVVLDPGKPQSKGQVERMIGYFERSFLPLRTFDSLDDLQTQFDAWTNEVAFTRYHRRVGARVGDAFNVERGLQARSSKQVATSMEPTSDGGYP
jgi:transposase